MEELKESHPAHDEQLAHHEHLCYLTNLHFHQTNWVEYKKLVEGSQYVCKLCGRSAADKDRLCHPQKL